MRLVRLSSLLLALALTLPALGQGIIPIRRAAAGGAPVDWTSSFIAVWPLDEASGTRDALGSCGSDCDLTDNNTVEDDTVNFTEGTAAALFVEANNEYLSCLNQAADCDELAISGASATWGCWARPTSTSESANDFMMNSLSSNAGFSLRGASASRLQCVYGQGSSNPNVSSGTATADDTYVHAVCRLDIDGADTLDVFADGAVSASTGGTGNMVASGVAFVISNASAGTDYDGRIDECFVIADVLSDQEICRVCSCRIDGGACSCNGTAYTDSGDNVALCGSCTLPDCNAAAP